MFRRYNNRSLMGMTSHMLTSSKEECTILCLRTNGCLAVSVTPANNVVWCNLVTSTRDGNDSVDNAGSEVHVLGTCGYFIHGSIFCSPERKLIAKVSTIYIIVDCTSYCLLYFSTFVQSLHY